MERIVESMTFPEYRELLMHINAEHSPIKMSDGRQVKRIDCSTDMRNGRVFHVKIFGSGWEKTFDITGTNYGDKLLPRIHAFLDGEGEPDAPRDMRAIRAAQLIADQLVSDFSDAILMGVEFGANSIKFSVPIDTAKRAAEEASASLAATASTPSGHSGGPSAP